MNDRQENYMSMLNIELEKKDNDKDYEIPCDFML